MWGTSDFIQVLHSFGAVEKDSLLVRFDVESLYTNIPHVGGLEAIEHVLNQRTENCIPSTTCLKDLTDIVLTNNFFLFENYFY